MTAPPSPAAHVVTPARSTSDSPVPDAAVAGLDRGQAVAVSVGSQLVVRGLHFALNIATSLILIRYLSPTGFGDWVFITTLTVLFGLVGDFGLDKISIFRVVREPAREGEIVGTTIAVRLALAVGGVLLVQAVLAVADVRGEMRLAGLVSSLVFFVQALRAVVISFHVRVQQQYDAGVLLVAETLETALLVALVVSGAGLVALVAAPVAGLALGVGLAWWLTRRRYRLRLRVDTALARELLASAWPVAVALVIGVLYLRVDSLLLALLRPREEVGIYGAAFQPIEYGFLASAVLANVLYPLAAHDHATSDHGRLQAMHRNAVEGLLAVLLVVPALLMTIAEPMVTSVFGDDFLRSARPLQVLSWALLGLTLSAWHATILLAMGRQRTAARINAAGLAVAVALDLTLIPVWGYHGAAVATVVAAAFLTATSMVVLARVDLTCRPSRLVRVVMAAAGLGATVATLDATTALPWWGLVGAGLLTYPVWLRIFGVVHVATALAALLDRSGPTGGAPAPTEPEASVAPPSTEISFEPSFTVVFPTYNRCDVTETTIRHLLACDYPPEKVELIAADNSTDGTPDMVRQYERSTAGRVKLLASEHRLPAVKRNEGLRLASGDYVIFLNDDLWVRPDFFRQHAAEHARHEDPVAVVGQCPQSEKMPSSPFSDWYRPFAYDEMADRAHDAVTYRYFWSMNLSLPRQLMLDRNLVFHEDWAHIGHEDVELGWRWTRAGYRVIYNPDAWGEHYHPHDLESACRLQESIGRGLRDLEHLVDDPTLLARYGVFTWQAPVRTVLRSLARRVLFNGVTAPLLRTRWAATPKDTPFRRWAYWKVLLHHTNVGYREQEPRTPEPTPTVPAAPGTEEVPTEDGKAPSNHVN